MHSTFANPLDTIVDNSMWGLFLNISQAINFFQGLCFGIRVQNCRWQLLPPIATS